MSFPKKGGWGAEGFLSLVFLVLFQLSPVSSLLPKIQWVNIRPFVLIPCLWGCSVCLFTLVYPFSTSPCLFSVLYSVYSIHCQIFISVFLKIFGLQHLHYLLYDFHFFTGTFGFVSKISVIAPLNIYMMVTVKSFQRTTRMQRIKSVLGTPVTLMQVSIHSES